MEVECSVLGNDEPEASVPGEIVLTGADWYDYEAKYTPGGMELVVPARLPDARCSRRSGGSPVDTFVRVGCAGLARVDFFVEDGERVLVNELNTMPGFTPTSVFPKLWEASGTPFPELCDRLLAPRARALRAPSAVRTRSMLAPRPSGAAGSRRSRRARRPAASFGDPDQVVAVGARRRCRA